MTVYLIDKVTNKIIRVYNKVTSWTPYYVEYNNCGRGKYYCDKNEYLTNILTNNN